jgi:hypothetical protein
MTAQPSPAAGSDLWQLVFISFAVVLILFEVFRGWNRGVARQLARLAGFIAGFFAAFFGANLVVPLLRPFLNFPDLVRRLGASAALFLIIYLVINGLGAALFKRTKQYESGMARLLCGLGGAFFGLFFGAFMVWMVIFGIRSLGAIADAHVRQQAAAQATPESNGTLHAVDVRRRLAGEIPEDNSSVMTSLARLKNSLELGGVGDLVKKGDVVPSQTYDTLGKIGRVASDPQSMERFLSYPGAQQLTNHPRVIALRNDPQVVELIQQGRLLELSQNEKVIEALNDPTLVDQIRAFDIQRALDYSLQDKH